MEDYSHLKGIKTLEEWAAIVIERWQTNIAKQRIGSSGTLLKSFTKQVINDSGGNPQKVMFTFEYYGRFVDMGVGKGVKADMVDRSNRTKKPWYSKQFIFECNQLVKIMAQRYSKIGADSFRIIENESFPDRNNNRRITK